MNATLAAASAIAVIVKIASVLGLFLCMAILTNLAIIYRSNHLIIDLKRKLMMILFFISPILFWAPINIFGYFRSIDYNRSVFDALSASIYLGAVLLFITAIALPKITQLYD
jgi:hypothetical protein